MRKPIFREPTTAERLIFDQLRGPAVAAGIVEPDALRLGDLSGVKLNDKGEVEGGAEFIAKLKERKPHLFKQTEPSSVANLSKGDYEQARADTLRGHPLPRSKAASGLLRLDKNEYAQRRRAIIR